MSRVRPKVDVYTIPMQVRRKARRETQGGIRVILLPSEIVGMIDVADIALNGDSNDAEHDVLYRVRERLSELLEDPTRRTRR